MRLLITLFLSATFILQACTPGPQKVVTYPEPQKKQHDLVLIHGLANKHKWSTSFLKTCLRIWGSERVFVVYTGKDTSVTEMNTDGKKLIIGGRDGGDAGNGSINEQVFNISIILRKLQEDHGLEAPFSIIAHSMGGLVARKYISDNPGKVAGLVTLGAPHHGSPLANSFEWMGFFLDAADAINDLRPTHVAKFNRIYPISDAPLAADGKIYTIRGVPRGMDCFGRVGELFFGWQILSIVYETQSDGLVPHYSAIIDGAQHIGDFPGYDHYRLVRQPDVAKKAAEYLP